MADNAIISILGWEMCNSLISIYYTGFNSRIRHVSRLHRPTSSSTQYFGMMRNNGRSTTQVGAHKRSMYPDELIRTSQINACQKPHFNHGSDPILGGPSISGMPTFWVKVQSSLSRMPTFLVKVKSSFSGMPTFSVKVKSTISGMPTFRVRTPEALVGPFLKAYFPSGYLDLAS